ncbi:hypothetical protein [Vibrio navarrensis]|uniref:hypothetical protein n=1 Tax=Vibrio navarrensis TaxID=29495 RepID=UPI001D05A6AA|nr:hypothetical protein [Vibrio navarrensis]
MNNTVLLRILTWLAKDGGGLSSQFMVFTALGIEPKRVGCYPRDPADFNRCLVLIDRVPEVKNFFDVIAQSNPQWSALIKNWDLIEQTFLEEAGLDWSKNNRAPKTYALMKEILKGAKA